ncbi:hypothetical protein DFH08DRAFT_956794 [Mycena albidolilacea]|uniref:Uncharacterized protein n=1 Tax=Mycena albidolilacea TaxID=1033008 RepID=A0AAD7EWE6_9AGAR|nr:hypothetical protein DFH08DRAFT_956794 [Mycena albidolilacea]
MYSSRRTPRHGPHILDAVAPPAPSWSAASSTYASSIRACGAEHGKHAAYRASTAGSFVSAQNRIAGQYRTRTETAGLAKPLAATPPPLLPTVDTRTIFSQPQATSDGFGDFPVPMYNPAYLDPPPCRCHVKMKERKETAGLYPPTQDGMVRKDLWRPIDSPIVIRDEARASSFASVSLIIDSYLPPAHPATPTADTRAILSAHVTFDYLLHRRLSSTARHRLRMFLSPPEECGWACGGGAGHGNNQSNARRAGFADAGLSVGLWGCCRSSACDGKAWTPPALFSGHSLSTSSWSFPVVEHTRFDTRRHTSVTAPTSRNAGALSSSVPSVDGKPPRVTAPHCVVQSIPDHAPLSPPLSPSWSSLTPAAIPPSLSRHFSPDLGAFLPSHSGLRSTPYAQLDAASHSLHRALY